MRSTEGKQRFLTDITSCIGKRVGPELSVGATESTTVFEKFLLPQTYNLTAVNALLTLPT